MDDPETAEGENVGNEMDGDMTWEEARDRGIEHLENDELPEAIERLTIAVKGDATGERDPTGTSEALLALAHFRSQSYGTAAYHYNRAIKTAGGDGSEWNRMLERCRQNIVADVSTPVPDVRLFTEAELLAPPPGPTLPTPPFDARPSVPRRIRLRVGRAVGNLGGAVLELAVSVVGENNAGEIWTNWYNKGVYRGVLTLGYMREKLNAHHLHSTYPIGAKIGHVTGNPVPPFGVSHFRTADGTWNSLEDPKEGAAGTRFLRNVDDDSIKAEIERPPLEPDPRRISLALLSREGEMKEVPFLNLLAASWIQFQNHDWISHGDNLTCRLMEIPFHCDDPAYKRYRQRKMFVARTQNDRTRRGEGEKTDPTFINEVTHWWDGSQIYGSDEETQMRLRSRRDGKMRVDRDGRLPLGAHGVEDTGMVRNWWVGLAMLHNLFVLEHNAICDVLKGHHPDWDDGRLFNVARLVNAAVMAKIHSIEWTPAILPNASLVMGLNANWYGLFTYRLKKSSERETVATYNVRNPELGGIVGNEIDKHDSPFGLTEEFVEVYRLHSMLPESLRLRDCKSGEALEHLPFPTSRQAGSATLIDRIGMEDLFYSFGQQAPGQLVLNNYPTFMQELSIPGNPVYDMGAVDILRARERGVPRYNEFRRQLGLKEIKRFEDLTDDAEALRRLKGLYCTVEDIDLLIGTLAEETRPIGFGFGETMFQIFILNASRRLQADRFYTTDFREEVYTREGMKWIDDATLKSVLLRHYPKLADTGLSNIKNAFEPWDTEFELRRDRHPLREFDHELGKDPWRGDAFRDPLVEDNP